MGKEKQILQIEEQELVSYGIVEGYERALKHAKETMDEAIKLIESGKLRSPIEVVNHFIANFYLDNEYLFSMKEFLIEEEELESENIESALVTLMGAISQIKQ